MHLFTRESYNVDNVDVQDQWWSPRDMHVMVTTSYQFRNAT